MDDMPLKGSAEWLDLLDDVVSDTTGVPLKNIYSRQATRRTATARKLIYYVLAVYLGWGTPQIGKRYNRDHTTVRSALLGAIDWIEFRFKPSMCQSLRRIKVKMMLEEGLVETSETVLSARRAAQKAYRM